MTYARLHGQTMFHFHVSWKAGVLITPPLPPQCSADTSHQPLQTAPGRHVELMGRP